MHLIVNKIIKKKLLVKILEQNGTAELSQVQPTEVFSTTVFVMHNRKAKLENLSLER